MYVASQFGTSVLKFAAGATGDATPVATLTGSHTGLSETLDLTFDAAGNLYAANYGNNTVTTYAKEPAAMPLRSRRSGVPPPVLTCPRPSR